MTYMIQIDDEIREATAEEAAIIETQQAATKAAAKAAAAKEKTRAAILDKLGLTAEELSTLIG